MTLANRITSVYLLALTAVLVGFSITLFVLARSHLNRQLNDRIASTMDTLVAAAEVEPDGLDWEPELRRLPSSWEGDPPVWAVYDEAGTKQDGSHDPMHRLADYAAGGPEHGQEAFEIYWDGNPWRVARRTIHHPNPNVVREPLPGQPKRRHRTLVFVSAVPATPFHDSIRALAGILIGVSMGLWMIAAVVGRWMSRRALAPVRRMAESTERITAKNLGERIPVSDARDELRDLALRFNDLLARLQVSFEQQQRFTGEASHQLRTPLTALQGQLEIALRRNRDPEEYRRVVATAHSQTERLRQIVESLLFLARADSDAILPDLEVLDLGVWVEEYLNGLSGDRKPFLQWDVPATSRIQVKAHSALLGQVVGNLIDNAFKYSDPEQPVVVSVAVESGIARLSVEDTGCGIDSLDLQHLFKPFFRSDEVRRKGISGVGLGLAVVDRIVAAFGGTVEVHGEPERGSCFSVRLPLHGPSTSM